MKRFIVVLFSCFVFSLAAQAQDTIAPTQHFIVSASAAGWGGQGGTQAISIASTGLQLTQNVSAAYEFISNPADSSQSRVHSGVINYTREVAAFLPAKLKAKLVFDPTNYIVTFQAGAGRQSVGSNSHVVGNFAVYVGRPMGNNTQLGCGYKTLVGASFQTIKIPVGTLNFRF